MNKLTVNITEKHIKGARRMDPHRCPVARAVREATSATYVCVNQDHVDWWRDGRPWSYVLPNKISDQIVRFDHTGKFKPMSFTMYMSQVSE